MIADFHLTVVLASIVVPLLVGLGIGTYNTLFANRIENPLNRAVANFFNADLLDCSDGDELHFDRDNISGYVPVMALWAILAISNLILAVFSLLVPIWVMVLIYLVLASIVTLIYLCTKYDPEDPQDLVRKIRGES